MPRAYYSNRRPRKQAHIPTHPQHRRRIVNLLQALRISSALKSENRSILRSHGRPFLFRGASSLAIKNMLRGFSRKTQAFELRKRHAKDAARRIQSAHSLKNAPRPKPRRQSQRKPRKAILIGVLGNRTNSSGSNFRRNGGRRQTKNLTQRDSGRKVQQGLG